MSSLADIGDVAALSDAELGTLLERLEREEREVSRRRSRLHDRIDFVQSREASPSPSWRTSSWRRCAPRSTSFSDRRHVLHREIDELRAERSRRRL